MLRSTGTCWPSSSQWIRGTGRPTAWHDNTNISPERTCVNAGGSMTMWGSSPALDSKYWRYDDDLSFCAGSTAQFQRLHCRHDIMLPAKLCYRMHLRQRLATSSIDSAMTGMWTRGLKRAASKYVFRRNSGLVCKYLLFWECSTDPFAASPLPPLSTACSCVLVVLV